MVVVALMFTSSSCKTTRAQFIITQCPCARPRAHTHKYCRWATAQPWAFVELATARDRRRTGQAPLQLLMRV